MPSYVEQAILRVKDESTKPIRKINKELKKLQSTAKKSKNMKIEVRGLKQAERDLNKFISSFRSLPKSKTVALNLTGAADIQRVVRALSTNRAVKINVAAPGLATLQKRVANLSRPRTLRLTVKSPSLTEVNRKIGALARRKGVDIPITLPGADKAISQLRTISSLLRNVRGANANIRVTPPRALGGSGGAGMLGAAAGAGGRRRDISDTFAFAAQYELAHLVINAGHVTVRSAVGAALEGQAVATQREIIIPGSAQQEELASIARAAAMNAQNVSLTRANQIVNDLFIGGLRGEVLRAAAPRIVELEGIAGAVDPERAQQLTMLANKIANLGNATESAEQTMALVDATFRAAIVQGESFNAATTLAALRTSGFASTISPEGLIGFSLAVDALGRQAGSAMNRLNKELFTPLSQAGSGAGIAKGAVESLMASGIRGEQGLTEEQGRAFRADPAKFIQTVIRDALISRGVDVEDRVATQRALAQAGFATTSQRIILDALSSIAEATKGRELAENIDFAGARDATADDLGFQIANLTEQFKTLSAVGLDGPFKRLAPHVASLADILADLAFDEGPGADLRRLKFVVASVVTTLVGLKVGLTALGKLTPGSRAAMALTGSAAKLDAAALALQRAAAAQGGAPGGVARTRPAGSPGSGMFSLGRLLATGAAAYSLYELASATDAQTAASREYVKSLDKSLEEKAKEVVPGVVAMRDNQRDWFATGAPDWVLWLRNSLTGPGDQIKKDPEAIAANAAAAAAAEAARVDAEERQGILSKIDRLLGVMMRNEIRLDEPRSAASEASLIQQQKSLSADVMSLADQAGVSIDSILTEEHSELRSVFGESATQFADKTTESLNEASATFGPRVGESLLPFAAQMGNVIGQSAVNALQGLNLNARVQNNEQLPALDMGESGPS